jgi:hypothetical protein
MARRHFESGASLRNIADLVGASSSGVAKHAKRHRWQRTRKAGAPNCAPTTTKAEHLSFRISPRIEQAAFEVPTLASKGRQIILLLMDELETETANPVLLAELIDAETDCERTAIRRRLLQKAVSLPVRAMAAKNLATALVALTTVPGKKAQARLDAEEAAKDETDWGGDLDSDFPTRPN